MHRAPVPSAEPYPRPAAALLHGAIGGLLALLTPLAASRGSLGHHPPAGAAVPGAFSA